MAEEGNSCPDCLDMCLSEAAVQVPYGNKDYAVRLCVFGSELLTFGHRRSMTDIHPLITMGKPPSEKC